jgi:hypothetical protein
MLECDAWRNVLLEDIEHSTLIVMGQVKEAAPSDETLEHLAQRQPAHGYSPSHSGESIPAMSNEGRGAVESRHVQTPAKQVPADRCAGATAEVERSIRRRDVTEKAIEPAAPIKSRPGTIGDALLGHSLVRPLASARVVQAAALVPVPTR